MEEISIIHQFFAGSIINCEYVIYILIAFSAQGEKDGWDLIAKGMRYMIKQFELEGTLKIILFQPPCHRLGHFPQDQVAQRPIQYISNSLMKRIAH